MCYRERRTRLNGTDLRSESGAGMHQPVRNKFPTECRDFVAALIIHPFNVGNPLTLRLIFLTEEDLGTMWATRWTFHRDLFGGNSDGALPGG